MAKRSSTRQWYISRSLESVVSLREVIEVLTIEETMHGLELESATRRRKIIINILITHAARLNKRAFIKSLKEKYDVPYSIENSGRG